jgi:hypothetical protein
MTILHGWTGEKIIATWLKAYVSKGRDSFNTPSSNDKQRVLQEHSVTDLGLFWDRLLLS